MQRYFLNTAYQIPTIKNENEMCLCAGFLRKYIMALRPTSLSLSEDEHKLSQSRQLSAPGDMPSDFRKLSDRKGLPKLEPLNIQKNLSNPTHPVVQPMPSGLLTATSPITTVVRRVRISEDAKSSPSNRSVNRIANADQPSVEITVHMMDETSVRLALDGENLANAEFLHDCTLKHLGIRPTLGKEVFSMWVTSPHLEVQLKSYNNVVEVRKYWRHFLQKYTLCDDDEIKNDFPKLTYKRNCTLSKRRQREIAHHDDECRSLLYSEARQAIMSQKYICSLEDSLTLSAIDMAIVWGKYDESKHTVQYIRDTLEEFIPPCYIANVRTKTLFGYAIGKRCRISKCTQNRNGNGAVNKEQMQEMKKQHYSEEILIEMYKERSERSLKELQLEYLEHCMALPTYGCASFDAYIERDVKGFSKMWKDDVISSKVCISREFISLIDVNDNSLILARPLLDCQWNFERAQNQDNCMFEHQLRSADLEYLPSMMLYYPGPKYEKSNDTHVMQIFTPQSAMIEALLNVALRKTNDETCMEIDQLRKHNSDLPTKDISSLILDDQLPPDLALPLTKQSPCQLIFNSDGECTNGSVCLLRRFFPELNRNRAA